jgi:ATP-dependent Clp protease ATP-binding subunit ClpC
LRRIKIHPSVQLAWGIANAEANNAGSKKIEPVHFLLAALKIIDDAYHQDAVAMQFPQKMLGEIAEVAAECRRVLKITDEEITAARRGLTNALRERADLKTGRFRMLHRSEESRALFQKGAEQAEQAGLKQLTLTYLLNEIWESLPPEIKSFFKEDRTGSERKQALSAALIGTATEESDGEIETFFPSFNESSKTPLLDEIGRDLTALALKGRLTQTVGRRTEMTMLARYLQRTSKRNVILIGDAGVGKTAVVEGLAQRIIKEDAPDFLRALRIVQINVADLVAGTKYRGEMEERLQAIIAETVANPNIVLFLDEIHLVVKAGAAGEGAMDIAGILKPALARDDFRCIGATTTDEFERYLKADSALMRRFQVLRVGEPSEEEALTICREWARRIESIQQVVFEEDALAAAVSLSARLIRQRSLPDKAIDLLENAAAFVKVSSLSFSGSDYSKELPHIHRRQIEEVLEEQYGISVSAARALDVSRVETTLRAQLLGQDEAIEALSESLAALEARPESAARPLGVLMFIGPTGVGKTFAAETIGRALFGEDERSIGRFNMSEYKERHELARLIGAPPGFVGHEYQGALFRFVEGNPQGLILLDEMEKAHAEIQDYFLQIFDKGEARDSRGRLVDFRRHVFIMTCNEGLDQQSEIGFRAAAEKKRPETHAKQAAAQLLKHFRQEFIARLDRLIVFRALSTEDYGKLFERQIANLSREVEQRYQTRIETSEDVRRQMCELYADRSDGARGFLRLFERTLAAPLFGYLDDGPKTQVVRIAWDGDAAAFSSNEEEAREKPLQS